MLSMKRFKNFKTKLNKPITLQKKSLLKKTNPSSKKLKRLGKKLFQLRQPFKKKMKKLKKNSIGLYRL